MSNSETAHRINVSSETFERLIALRVQEGWSKRKGLEACISVLLDKYETPPDQPVVQREDVLALLGYSEADINPLSYTQQVKRCAERDDIIKAMQMPSTDFWDMVRVGVVREARIRNTQAEKLATADFTAMTSNGALGQMRKNRLRGSSAIQIDRYVKDVMARNCATNDPWEILYLTKGIVRRATGIHSMMIAAYFDEHAAELEAHYQALGIDSEQAGLAHNRKRLAYWRKQGHKGEVSTMVQTDCEG